MAATSNLDESDLRHRLASVLPKDRQFGIYHLSTPPTKTNALCSPPPNERPDRTYCENHFLAVSIDDPNSQTDSKRRLFILAVEVLIFTTAHSTTLFVSKADSTGYLDLLGLPRGAPSPIRGVCSELISYLVEARRRKDVQFVVSLFARAQSQYLFPGSAQYKGKHVLDDRGLVRWWCRVLNPLIERPPVAKETRSWNSVKGFLVVPGLDAYEMRALVPKGPATTSWSFANPLELISHYQHEFDWVPPRCLIPRFPDDPKSRFRDELDEEAAKSGEMRTTGNWKSVKTLDTFWEMMAFRQECSSGRMTGFIWLVLDDNERSMGGKDGKADSDEVEMPQTPKKERQLSVAAHNTTPKKLFPSKCSANDEQAGSSTTKRKGKKPKAERKLKGKIQPRAPRLKTAQRNYLLKRPAKTAYYDWASQGRGERIVGETDYKRIVELLLHLDFATVDKAAGSTKRWISEVGMGSGWGYDVTGTKEAAAVNDASSTASTGQVNNLSGLVKRKRADGAAATNTNGPAEVKVLNSSMIRKKPKT